VSAWTTLYSPGLPGDPGASVNVDRDGVRHIRAARLRPGAELRLTDGEGALWAARLDSLTGNRARCVLLETLPSPPDLRVELAFGVASKPRTLWLVEKAVELGVPVLQPIEFRRSSSVSDAARAPAFWGKARRKAAAALTQCGGSRLPSLRAPCSLEEYLTAPASRRDRLRVALDRSGEDSLSELLSSSRPGANGWILLLVGPEGGMAPAERTACRAAGFRFATLGQRVLRFETAAVAGVTAVSLMARPRAPATRSERSEVGDAEVPS
jgi:16S rRNA (uracil1498-N3)-methyltransferase